ncbi:MAG: SUMF1/EgtB/PvdO family nonheme iron enzyme [Mariniphaga sp.]|nr:SUMF1/EgtB/PvdO family nonheme iron enzyme [Mariniphaga sp.]
MIRKLKILKKPPVIFILAALIVSLVFYSFNKVVTYTSSDQYCMSCHVHPHAEINWKLSAHSNNRTGVKVHCAECHLPPKENGIAGYSWAKAKHGFKDVYGYLTKDPEEIDWEAKRTPDKAVHFVYETSCIKCHSNLYPATLSNEGSEAHLNYEMNPRNRTCITCHIDVGHYDPSAHQHNLDFGLVDFSEKEKFTETETVTKFANFTDKIPGTSVSFNMKAIPGSKFILGSNQKEPYRLPDEGPQREVEVNGFFMAEIEVSWDEYLAFFNATSSQGRKEANIEINEEVDGITGATPPWGAPDQGWGKSLRPAITMTHHAAMTYCRWLSQVTGKTYRLPTEAEWEYAARGGSKNEYFFEGNPKNFERDGLINKIFGPDTAIINSYVVYTENSPDRTQEPSFVQANPFGLKNMLGNVAEFCLDYYDPIVYGKYPAGVVKNPRGPRTGTEHVIRGGSFMNSARNLRVADRDYTTTKEWLVTDPQIPKSIWWYSDCKHVGFRVVCEYDVNTGNQE